MLYYDGPWPWVFRDATNSLALAYLSAAGDGVTRHLATPISAEELVAVKEGVITVRSVFKTWAWVVLVGHDGNVISVERKLSTQVAASEFPPSDLTL